MQRYTREGFIQRAKEIHGDKYDYSKVEYKNSDTRVCIICPAHGEFMQLPNNHINAKQGCSKCYHESVKKPVYGVGINDADYVFEPKDYKIWRNGCYGNFKQTEAIITNEKYPTSIVKIEKEFEHNKHYHPTQKPTGLIEWLIKTYSNEGDLILDSCMGSGTTAIVCLRTNRNFIGYELTKEYYDIAMERIKQEQMNQTLF